MEVAVELEDDLFFADLSKEIALLIMDEDEEEDPLACCPPNSLQVLYYTCTFSILFLFPFYPSSSSHSTLRRIFLYPLYNLNKA